MKSFTQAATLFSTLASASLLSSSPASTLDSVAKDITTVAGTTGSDHLTIHFRAPCQGCFIGTDDGLEITLEIDAAEEECSSRPARLNGLPLSVNGSNDVASGQISFKSKPSNGLGEKEVHAAWESTCLKGEASLVSVRFEDIDGHDTIKATSGFTTSFKQKGQPTVLRLQDKPVDQISQGLCNDWLLPEDHKLSITPFISDSTASIDDLLQAEYDNLEKLKLEMDKLHEQMHQSGARILSLYKQEFKACSSMKCLWDTAISKVPAITKMIVSHFSHRKDQTDGCKDGDAQSPCSIQDPNDDSEDKTTSDSSQLPKEGENGNIEASVTSPPTSSQPSATRSLASMTASSSPATESEEVEVSAVPDEVHAHHPPPFWGDHPPFRPSHGPPPGFPHHGPPPGERPPFQFGPPGRHHRRPGLAPFRDGRRTLEFRLGLAIILLVLLVILVGIVLHVVRQYRDPRRRAERAARREERRTRRLYRKAACKHKWRTWWKRCRSSDYEEKRQMILEQEGILEDVMQQEIVTLRNATDLVRDLVRAEEGRARTEQHGRYGGYLPQYPPTELDAGEGSSRLSDVPPSYLAPPPRYEEDLEGELTVVDGFRYTPSNTDDTPESSIIDCSPRLSLETGRSTIDTKDAHE